MDSQAAPSCIHVRIKASKTDPFRRGVTLVSGRTDNVLCPVKAVLSFMVAGAGPLFSWEDKRFLTREAFVAAVRAALTEAGLVAPDTASGLEWRRRQPAKAYRTR